MKARRDDLTIDLFAPFGSPERPTNKIEARFWAFHAANPHIYELFDRFTREVVRAGRSYFGVSPIIERMRWYTSVETVGEDVKINNNYRAYYARLWMRDNPEHGDIFQTRRLPSGEVSAALKRGAGATL